MGLFSEVVITGLTVKLEAIMRVVLRYDVYDLTIIAILSVFTDFVGLMVIETVVRNESNQTIGTLAMSDEKAFRR